MCTAAHNASLEGDRFNHSVNGLSQRLADGGDYSFVLYYLLVTMWTEKCIHFLHSFENTAL